MTNTNHDLLPNTDHPMPTKEQVKAWVREANHNEPMFYQVACMAAEWATNYGSVVTAPTNHGRMMR